MIDVTLPLAAELRGTKHLVAGNHDRCWPSRAYRGVAEKIVLRAPEWRGRYYRDAGFASIQDEAELTLSDGTSVKLCHFPYEGDSGSHDRYLGARPADDGRWLLHGHVHESFRQRGRMINVGVDAWALAPVSEDEIVTLIGTGPVDRDPLPMPDVRAKPDPDLVGR